MKLDRAFSCPSLLIALAGTLLVACSTGVFLRPTASGSAEYVRVVPQCPGPKQVVQFTPHNTRWVHFRVYAELPNAFPDITTLQIEVTIDNTGLGMPWTRKYYEALASRSAHRFEFHTEGSHLLLIYADGKESAQSVSLFEGTHMLQAEESHSVRIASEHIALLAGSGTRFKVKMPAIFIDGERIDIPLIEFAPAEERYMPVISC